MAEKGLTDKLYEDQKLASKAKDRFRLSVIRMLRAELQNSAIEKRAPLEADEELAILSREVKKRQESLGDYKRAGRQDLVDDLHKEIEILQEYLPEQLSEEELEKMVEEAIAATGAGSKKAMGKVMGLIMPKVKGKADGNTVRRIVEDKLE
ncbi:MAG: GatB/YqeY domain-containing protein [Bacillota bacterium]